MEAEVRERVRIEIEHAKESFENLLREKESMHVLSPHSHSFTIVDE